MLKEHKQSVGEILTTQNFCWETILEWEILLNPDCLSFSPESPDTQSIQVISQSIRVTFAQRLFSSVSSINTPLTPSVISLLLNFEPDQVQILEQALSLPPLWFLRDFLRDSSERLASEEIWASEHPFQPLSTSSSSSPQIQVYYSWSFELLDG